MALAASSAVSLPSSESRNRWAGGLVAAETAEFSLPLPAGADVVGRSSQEKSRCGASDLLGCEIGLNFDQLPLQLDVLGLKFNSSFHSLMVVCAGKTEVLEF